LNTSKRKVKNKAIFLFFFTFFLVVPLVNATLLDVKSFDRNIPKYGQIEIKDWLGLSHKADYTLTDYNSSVINVYAEGTYKLYQKTHLFTGVFYKDIIGNRGDLRDVKFYIWNEEYETRYNPIYEQQNCKLIYDETSKNQTKICDNVLISNESYQVDVSGWIPYKKGMDLPESEGRWRLEAKRPANKKIDFILEAHGKTFDEWAWWDNSWDYKRQINLTANAGEFSYLFWVDYDSDMQSDYDDLRFVNNAEDTEFNYTIQTYNTTRAVVRVYSQGETSFWMYYGNPTASSGSSASDTHFNPVSYYYLDETSGSVIDAVGSNDGTNNGATPNVAGKINTAYDFTPVDKITTPISSKGLGSNNFAISFWFNSDDLSVTHYLIGGSSNPAGHGWYLTTNSERKLKFTKTGIKDYIGSTTLSTGTWYHVVALVDSSNRMKLYLNGNLEIYGSDTNAISFTNAGNIALGSLGATYDGSMDGKIDEVGMWDRALTSTEIEALYNYTAPTYTIGDEQTVLIINQISPEDNYNSTSRNVSFECNAQSPTGVYSLNLTINGTVYETVTGDGTTNLTLSSTETLGEGYWEWYCTANDDTKTENSPTRSLVIDVTPPQIEITSPTGTYDYLYPNYNLTLNTTVNDTHLDTCWYEYNGTNNTFSCTTGVLSTEYFNYSLNENNLTVWANDTFGNLNSSSIEWDYHIFEQNRTYNNETIETKEENFKITLITNEDIDVYFYYDGEQYSTIENIISGNIKEYSTNLTIPAVTSDSNKSFYWWVNSGLNISTTESSILVKDLLFNFDETYPLLNITIYDETTGEIVNETTLELFSDYYVDNGNIQETIYNSSTKNGTYDIGTNLLTSLFTSNQFSYTADGYQNRQWNGNLNLVQSSLTDLELYLLQYTSGTIQFFKIYDSLSYEEIPGALIIAKRVVGDEEIFADSVYTDDSGEGNLWLNPDIAHKITIYKEGCSMKSTTMYPTGTSIKEILLDCESEETETYNSSSFLTEQNISLKFYPEYREITYNSSNESDHIKNFSIVFSSDNCEINSATFKLINLETEVVLGQEVLEDCNGTITIPQNVTSLEKIKATVILMTNQTISKSFIYLLNDIGNLNYQGSSINNFLNKLTDFTDFGLSNGSKTFIAFIVLFLILGYLSIYGIIRSEGYAVYLFVLIYIFILSYFNWFYLDLPVTIINSSVQENINKWVLFLISSIGIGGLMLSQAND